MSSFRSTYDAASNLLTLTDPESTEKWVYDDLYRVTSETNELSDRRNQ